MKTLNLTKALTSFSRIENAIWQSYRESQDIRLYGAWLMTKRAEDELISVVAQLDDEERWAYNHGLSFVSVINHDGETVGHGATNGMRVSYIDVKKKAFVKADVKKA